VCDLKGDEQALELFEKSLVAASSSQQVPHAPIHLAEQHLSSLYKRGAGSTKARQNDGRGDVTVVVTGGS
jgi:hypothetical protein